MKKFMLGVALATGLVVAMAGQSLAADLTTCDMEQAIAEAVAAIDEVGGERSVLRDAKGVSIQEHVEYLQKRVAIARAAVTSGYAKYPEELYATITEGTRALRLITGLAKEETRQIGVSKMAEPQVQAQVQSNTQTAKVEKNEKVAETSKTVQANAQAVQATLAVAKIEANTLGSVAKLASLDEDMKVATPEEVAGLSTEMKVPATGTVDTGELEKIVIALGIASVIGMLGAAGILAVIGRR